MTGIADGVVIGSAGGALAGLTLWLFQYLHDKVVSCMEANRIYKWLKENTEDEVGKQFRSTRAIASWTNLTEDRVRYLCSIDERIFLSTGENEDLWSIFVHVRKSTFNIG